MSDFHATEKLIGGSVVVGIASLLRWNASQGGDSGTLGTVLLGVMVLGGIWATIGLFDLMARPRAHPGDARIGTPPSEPPAPSN